MKYIKLSQLAKTDIILQGIAGAPQNWKNGEKYSFLSHARENSGFLLVLCKRAVYTFPNGEELIAKKNSIVYMPKGARYLVRFEQEDTPVFPASILLEFCLSDLDGKWLLFREQTQILTEDEDGRYKKFFLRIVQEYLANNRLLLHRDFLTLLYELTQTDREAIEEPLLREIIEYIDSFIKELPSVKEIAKKFALSESTLRRLFQKSLQCSPIQYIHQLKIEKAKLMLMLSENRIEGISEELGFFDVAHFNKVFYRYVRCSPKKYRETYLKRQK